MRAGVVALALGAALSVLAVASTAHAHTRSVSYSDWSVRGHEAAVGVRISRLDHDALLAWLDGAPFAEHLRAAIGLRVGDAACTPVEGSFNQLSADPGWRRYEWRLHCPSAGALSVHSELLFDVVAGHVHFAHIGGVELALGEEAREARVPAPAGALVSARRFVSLGVTHIFSGFDHLVFLLVLVLMARSLSDVGLAVTGFTVGHSATLALATLGYASPDVTSVEALIGLSIAVVAVSNVWESRQRRARHLPIAAVAAIVAAAAIAPFAGALSALTLAGVALFVGSYFGLLGRARRPARLRCAVAGLFGMVHGFGFAGVLQQLELPADRLVGPLLGFNVGVELGQLAVLVLVWPIVVGLRRLGPRFERASVAWASAAALALGMFWFVSRAYG